MRIIRLILACALLTCAIAPATHRAEAQVPVFDEANWLQNQQNNIQTITQLANQFTSLQNQLANAKLMTQELNGPAVWGRASALLASLQQTLDAAINAEYASRNLATQFGRAYPAFGGTATYQATYAQMTTQTLAQVRQALLAAGYTSQQVQNEKATMTALESLSDGSVGHLQAIQAGNKIALMGISEMQQLRTLVATQTQQSAAFSAQQVTDQAAVNAKIRAMWAGASKPSPVPSTGP